VEDPAVYERPWQMSMPLYKRIEDHARLFEFKCPEFAEEILYDHLTRENYFRNLGIELDGENDE